MHHACNRYVDGALSVCCNSDAITHVVHPDTGVPSCGLLSRENWNEDCTLQSLLLVLQVQYMSVLNNFPFNCKIGTMHCWHCVGAILIKVFLY